MRVALQNLLEVFLQSAEEMGDRPCLKFKDNGRWKNLSWVQVEERVKAIALGLKALGVKKGDNVAIFSETRVEWTLCDLAILSLGAVTVPIYQSNTAEQVSYILQDSESGVVIVENKDLYQKVRQGRPPKKIILMTGKVEGDKNALTLEKIESLGLGDDQEGDEQGWRKGIEAIHPSDMATFVYTSGTTGPPKGVMLTHGNFLAELEGCLRTFDITLRDTGLLFLPLAHIFARVMQFFQLRVGCVHAYAESIDKLIDNLGEVKPHFFASVPRIFEKVHERILQQVEEGSPLKKAVFSWATAVGRDIGRKRQEKGLIGPLLLLQEQLASFLVFRKLRQKLGGRLRYAVSGGAPLSKEIGEFFYSTGVKILEGYGLTETTAAINCNTPRHFRFGTVGRAVHGIEEKIAPDGEILVKGPMIFEGYYKNPEATREVLTADGWFKTGDIGEIDADGFLKITDRKKDIIVTAAGKNIAPQNIEKFLKTVPFISQVVVHGDRRKYLSALVTLNHEPIEEYARSTGIDFGSFHELAKHPKVFNMVKRAIDEKNKKMASFETIKRFAILENDFSQESGELTPTLKVKRKFVSEKYRDVLDKLYQE